MDRTGGDLDALRRRLYRPDADAEDVRRYEAALALREPLDVPRAPVEPVPVARAPRRLLPALVAATALLVVAGIGTGLALTAAPAPRPTPAPTAPDGRVERLRWVEGAGVQAYRGHGGGVVAVDPTGLPADGGRLTVLFTTAATVPVRWAAVRIEPLPAPVSVLAAQNATQTAGVPVPVDFDYDGAPPTWIRVDAPAGTTWGLVVSPAETGPRLR